MSQSRPVIEPICLVNFDLVDDYLSANNIALYLRCAFAGLFSRGRVNFWSCANSTCGYVHFAHIFMFLLPGLHALPPLFFILLLEEFLVCSVSACLVNTTLVGIVMVIGSHDQHYLSFDKITSCDLTHNVILVYSQNCI